MGYGMGWRGGLYKGIKWELWSCLWGCIGVFVGLYSIILDYFYIKVGESMEKWEFFVGF